MNRRKKKNLLEQIGKYVFFLFLALFMLYFLFIDDYGFIKKSGAHKKIKNIKRKITLKQDQNEMLSAENKELKTNPDKWEEEARKIGMIRKGEKIYRFKKEKGSN